jgi:urea transporter
MPGATPVPYARGSQRTERGALASRGPAKPLHHLATMHDVSNQAESAALRTLLRSLGQIVLQPNAFTGLCLLALRITHKLADHAIRFASRGDTSS